MPRRHGLQVHLGEERRGGGGAHDVRVRRALWVQPVRVRARGDAVRAGEQEGQLLLRRGLQLRFMRLGEEGQLLLRRGLQLRFMRLGDRLIGGRRVDAPLVVN